MRAYIVTTGAAFGLLTLTHIARMFEEGAHLITQPVFLLTTVGSASVCVWAIILLQKLRHSGDRVPEWLIALQGRWVGRS